MDGSPRQAPVARRRAPAGVCVLAVALLPLRSPSDTIVIRFGGEYGVTNGIVHFSGTIENLGDTIAERAVLVLEPPFGTTVTNALGHLDRKTPLAWRTSVRLPRDALPGRHVAIVRIAYADANGYPLDTFFAMPFDLGGPAGLPPVAAALEGPTRPVGEVSADGLPPREEPVPLEHALALRLTAVPLTSGPTPARLRIVLPRSIGIVPPWPELAVLPSRVESSTFTITNLSALAGSRLPVCVLLETTSAGRRHTAVASMHVTIAGTPIAAGPAPPPVPRAVAGGALAAWLLAELLRRRRPRNGPPGVWLDCGVLAAILWLLARQFPLGDLVSDTLTVGGDTPAHHYLLAHLREQVLQRGRVVSWAPGWWCGFPMFQFYFPLPYLAMVAFSLVLPVNIAFKLGTVVGVFALPGSAYVAGRLLRLPRPLPAFLALATLPLLLDTQHTMWGVNLYSTLAGMLANSHSFALLPVALASALRDALDGAPRPRTVLLLAALVLSHFFTALFAALLLAGLFVALAARAGVTRAADDVRRAATLVPLGILTFLLTAWWLVPLVATRPWSVDFGGSWDISVIATLPVLVRWAALPAIAVALALLAWRRLPLPAAWRACAALHVGMLAAAFALFAWGTAFSAVFVNCRFWPFLVHAILVLAALVAGLVAARCRWPAAATATGTLIVLAFPWTGPNHAPSWARYNYRGLEGLPEGRVLYQIADTLRGTPGRAAYDLHPGNTQLGSSRIFETLPKLGGKPVIEGGIVNSALGALAAYTVQGEISDHPAGWPNRVRPRSFDPATGLRRLELMGVRHFIARSRKVQQALHDDPAWELREDFGKWQVFENPAADGALVRSWTAPLPVHRTDDLQGAIVDWLSHPGRIAAPWVFVTPGQPPPPDTEVAEGAPPPECAAPPAPGFLDRVSTAVPLMVHSADRLRFRTEALGKPHFVAVSYFPNWRVRGARHVYPAGPGFMVVYPEEHDVELRFGRTAADRWGKLLSGIGLLVTIVWQADQARTGSAPKRRV